MHEALTCEIALLPGSGPPLWPAAPAVQRLPADVAAPSPQAGPPLARVVRRLQGLLRQPFPSRRLQMAVREFLRQRRSYRAYRLHPDLDLPATTNAVEAMGRLLRDLARRVRNFRSPRVLEQWAIAFIRHRPEVTCNGKHFQPN